MVPPSDDSPKSLGDGATGSDVEPSSPQSVGDQSTTGDMGSSISDLVDVGEDFGDGSEEIVDLEARYEIQETLGIGGMGEVVLARDKRLNRQVAIKRLKEELGANRKAAQRFLTEAQSVAALNHFNIVQIHDYGRASDGPFIVMEYVGGGSLAEVLADGEPLELERVIELGSQLCEAIGVAHQAGIIHRDIKPANVLMTAEGMPKLTDFGLARQETVDGGQTQAGAVLGTLDFMPPEQKVDATQADARSDLWSVGATLYQAVTGDVPRVVDLEEVPQLIRSVLARALKAKPEVRYQTAEEFREALREVRPDSTPATSDGTLVEGECPSCGTENDSTRKFCKECAGPLRVQCLSCEDQIPIWEKICGECGGKQADLVGSRLEELQQQRGQAEQLRSEYAYEAALRIVEEVIAIDDERLLEHKPWAEEFLSSTKAEWEREEDSARKHFEESQEHRDAFDYNAAIHVIQSIPESMRSSVMVSHLQDLESDQRESHELIRTIRDRVKCRDLDGLLVQVDRAVKLQGNREDLRKLQGQLQGRELKLTQERNNTYIRASELLAEGKAKSAFSLIKKVRDKQLTNLQIELRNALEKMVAAEEEISTLVREAKANVVIEPEKVIALLPKAIEYLELNPNHAGIRQLREDLLAQAQKCPTGVLAKLSEDIRALLPGQDQERIVSCNYCKADVKAKRMIRHFDNNHSREGHKARERLKQRLRGAK